MNVTRTLILATALALGSADAAQAQGFFERLFGIAPSRPEPPPPVVYGRPPPPPEGLPVSPDEPRRPVERAPARPVSLKQPSNDTVVGRDLKLNGNTGALRIDRTSTGDFAARMTLLGRKSADSPDICSIEIGGGGGGAALVNQGRPEGLQRFQLADPVCPMQLDLVDDAVLVKGPSEACVFVASGCQSDPNGMWGPEPGALIPRAKDFETIRASADKAARDNYRVMTQRAKPEGVRPIVAEQAAFSADRENVCRGYAREAVTNFCNARFSEARAITLASKLGVSTTASTQTAETPRRRTRIPAEDPYGIPPTDELMQQPRERFQ